MFNFIRTWTLIMVTVSIFHSLNNIAMAQSDVGNRKEVIKRIKDKEDHFDIQIERAVEKRVKAIERQTERDERIAEEDEREFEREIRESADRFKKDILKNLKDNHQVRIEIDEDYSGKKEKKDDGRKEVKVVMNTNDNSPPVEIIVPVAFFMTFPFCLFLLFFFKHRTNREKQITLRTMVENGTNIPPEMFMEGKSRLTPIEKDRKNGIVYTLSSIGIILFLLILNAGPSGLWSIGFIPLLMGIGNLINWKMASAEKSNEIEVDVTTESVE